MNWLSVLSVPPNRLSAKDLESIPNHLSSVDANALSTVELRKFFELNRFLINRLSNDSHRKNSQTSKGNIRISSSFCLFKHDFCDWEIPIWKSIELRVDKKLLKGSDTDESYYIQTIQELNREIAQHVFNKNVTTENGAKNALNSTDADSLQPLAIETKRDLLYKIHVKNKYIKRLLSENDVLKADIEKQNEQILLLNVSLKEKTHKLTKAIAELSEQKNRNHMTDDDMADLHAKINSVREQMTQSENDKQKYKNDVLYLGDEIQKKINQWNELLKKKYSSYQANEKSTTDPIKIIKHFDDDIEHGASGIRESSRYDENRFEVNVLSQVINKRNFIITEMESLLIDLTMEISQSANVINRIIANLSKRETNFAYNLEKLRNHLAKLLERPHSIEYEDD